MQIAIVAPSSVPFCIGGAEKLWWGLSDWVNQNTPHQVDLIKLPSFENAFCELVDSYKYFSELNLAHFDLVISTKYPAWMVKHPRHICYMQHRLRGLYDTYHLTGYPEIYNSDHPEIKALQQLIKSKPGCRNILKDVFASLEQLQFKSNCPKDAFQFPGALIREVTHFLDGVGLATSEICKYAAISYNVANRKQYFPLKVPVEVIHHPSNLKSFRRGNDDYLFTVSRLDSAKRISLLIQAMKYVKSNIQLKIAGTGPDADSLKILAGEDERIVFLGFINDCEVVDFYADALVVPYVPYDEDYGLVTIEGMMSSKPVLTTTDAGGPNEFVVNGETGYSVAPDPQALADRIDYLCEHRNEAKEMGLIARKRVLEINWENTVTRLLGENKPSVSHKAVKKHKKITVALTFPVFPPRGGGQSRVFHLYRHLASQFDIELVSFTNPDQKPFQGEIAPHLYETRVPKSQEHQQQEWFLEQRVGVTITDVAMPQLYHFTPDYLQALKTSAESSDFIIACHPFLLPAIQAVSKKPIWYEAQDVEAKLKKSILPDNASGRELLEATCRVEQECCNLSKLIMVCSNEDAILLNQIHNVDLSKIVEVPNGVDLGTIDYVSMEKREDEKTRLGLDNSFTALFMGSWHGPNLEAVRHIFEIARELPQINFLVVGSVGLAFRDEKRPTNVGFLGVVDDETKAVAFAVADVALNPVTFGSGTNLKMLEYFAAGIPVISTPVGVRGLGVDDGKQCTITELKDFAEAIAYLKYESLENKSIRVEVAKQYVQDKFDWQAIAHKFIEYLSEII